MNGDKHSKNLSHNLVEFEVFTALSTKMPVFWVVEPSPSGLIPLIMEAVKTSQTLVNCYKTTRRYTTEDSHLLLIISSRLKFDSFLETFNEFGYSVNRIMHVNG